MMEEEDSTEVLNNDYPVLPSNDINSLGDHSNKAAQRIQTFAQKYLPVLAKNAAKFDIIAHDLITEPMSQKSEHEERRRLSQDMDVEESSFSSSDSQSKNGDQIDPPEPELSVHAQYLLMESLNNLKKTFTDMNQEHRHPIHHLISRCGKTIDSRIYSDLNRLLKNEKEIENNPENLRHANRLILEHLMGLGRTGVADTFMKESEMSLDIPNINNFERLKEIMGAFKRKDYLPAINWIKENAPERQDLLFQLQSQHVIRLLETSNKLAALAYVRELQSFPLEKYKQELAHLMFIVISYPQKGPYNYLFHEGRWSALEQELAHAITDYRSSLSKILNAGAKTIPSLMTTRAFLSSARPGAYPTLPDELPCNVPIPEPFHSSFCCPILKVQSTMNNPPVRLCCGHVISTDAMNKLAQQSRNNRLKCPYCPLESVIQETKTLTF